MVNTPDTPANKPPAAPANKPPAAPAGKPYAVPKTPPFPPRRDFSSLCVADLLAAREAHQVYLAGLENVVATAIGRYRIHKDDWYAKHPSDDPRPPDYPLVKEPRTLSNSVVRPWSWPAVLVFVREWKNRKKLGNQRVPSSLYMPDGRVIPTCVIQAEPDESLPPPVPGPSHVSPLLGGGYACLREQQGNKHLGTLGCLVYRDGSFYALTNRHVAGIERDVIRAFVRGEYHQVGTSTDIGITRLPMSQVFPSWAGAKTLVTVDAGLVRIDNFEDWTSQVFGIGEIGPLFDATEQSITLDLIGCPVRAFGATTGVIEGEIQALFFRHESLGGYDHVTDVLIGPRTGSENKHPATPFTCPGDSGTLWFYDPPNQSGPSDPEMEQEQDRASDRGARARRLRPVALQWGGQRFTNPDAPSSAFALATFASTVCRALDVDIVRNWSTGHDEYWGKLAHFAIGWKACALLGGSLAGLMKSNQERIGFGDQTLKEGSEFRVGRDGFVPLADVPDYVWVSTMRRQRPAEGMQHFADVDIYDINGGPPLLDRCVQDARKVSAKAWKNYFDGFAAAQVGPDEGALPFRVWQIWDAMVKYLKAQDVIHFVAAAGILAHYIGDASMPFHCSYLHHGQPPMIKCGKHKYPVRRNTDAFKAFQDTREYKIHSIYDETVLEVDTLPALARIDKLIGQANGRRRVKTGHDAAFETVQLMDRTRKRVSPQAIIKADKPELGPKARAEALWGKGKIRNAILESLADSVHLLGDLWTCAWQAGDGASIDPAKLVQFDEPDLEEIYREEEDFLPSLSLAKMVDSGRFEPA